MRKLIIALSKEKAPLNLTGPAASSVALEATAGYLHSSLILLQSPVLSQPSQHRGLSTSDPRAFLHSSFLHFSPSLSPFLSLVVPLTFPRTEQSESRWPWVATELSAPAGSQPSTVLGPHCHITGSLLAVLRVFLCNWLFLIHFLTFIFLWG